MHPLRWSPSIFMDDSKKASSYICALRVAFKWPVGMGDVTEKKKKKPDNKVELADFSHLPSCHTLNAIPPRPELGYEVF